MTDHRTLHSVTTEDRLVEDTRTLEGTYGALRDQRAGLG